MLVFEAIAAELERLRLSALFGLMGEETAKLTIEIERRGARYFSTRHEAAAVGMADGYARSSGEVGVAVVSRGPGLTNALTALVTAAKARSNVVVLIGAGDVGVHDPERAHAALSEEKHVDQEGLLRAAGVASVTLARPESAAAEMAAIVARARAGMTIAVNLPADVLEAEAGAEPARISLPAAPPRGATPSAEAIAAVADLLEETWAARRVVVLAGRGAVRSRAAAEIARLADACGALLATTLMARSMFADHDFDVGVAGTFSSEAAIELLADADVVLAFGASLNPYTTAGGDLFKSATLVQFDSDPDAFERHQPVALRVVGDARLAAAALSEELARRGFESTGYRTSEVGDLLSRASSLPVPSDGGSQGALDPRALMAALDKVLPRERTVVVDNGHSWSFSSAYLSVPEPAAYISPLEYFCIGAGSGIALGAAVARPDRLTVLELGDGGAMMTLADLDTAVRYRLPIVVLVSNDDAFVSEVHFLRFIGWPDDLAHIPAPSFEAVARALGGRGLTITTLDEVDLLSEQLDGLAGPLIVDCKISKEVRADWLDAFYSGGLRARPASVR